MAKQPKNVQLRERSSKRRGWICECDTINNGHGKCKGCNLWREEVDKWTVDREKDCG